MNDLPDMVTSRVQIYADNTKIYRTINDIEVKILLPLLACISAIYFSPVASSTLLG